jgi:peptide/nickel transport system substrate-binding protein
MNILTKRLYPGAEGVTAGISARRRRSAAAFLAVALMVAACGGSDDGGTAPAPSPTPPTDGAAPAVERGGELVVAIGAMPPSLDPFAATSPPRSFLVYSIYSTLTRVDSSSPDARVVPNFADTWSQIDELTWEFKLKSGLSFPNGEPLDADAVVFALEYIDNPDNAAGIKGRIGPYASSEAIDATTVRITLTRPEVSLPRLMSALPLVPPALFEEMGPDAFFLAPVGTGSFQVEEFVPGERMVMVPNPNSVLGQPLADKITFVVIPEDSSRVAALTSGEVDIITKVPTDQASRVAGIDQLNVLNLPEPRLYNLDLYTTEGPLSDVRVRRAINLAVDSESLVANILGGSGIAERGQVVPPGVEGFCEGVTSIGYDLAEANRLMAEAGVSNLTLSLGHSAGFLVNDALLAQAIGAQIEQLDAVRAVELEQMEFSFYLEHFRLQHPRKDMFAWGMSSAPFVSATAPLERFVTGYPQRDLGYSNPAYDEVFAQIQRTPEGTPERAELFCRASQIIKDDAPLIFGLYFPDLWGYRDAVNGFEVDIAGNPPFEKFWKG